MTLSTDRASTPASVPFIHQSPGTRREDGNRPDGITIIPLATSTLHTSQEVVKTAASAEIRKTRKYSSLTSRGSFGPCSDWDSRAVGWINILTSHRDRPPKCQSHWRKTLHCFPPTTIVVGHSARLPLHPSAILMTLYSSNLYWLIDPNMIKYSNWLLNNYI